MAYGTLQKIPESAPRTSRFTKVAAVSTAILLCLGFASVSHTRQVVLQRTIDANKARASASPVSPLVAEKTAEVVNMTEYGLRWAIFGFDSTSGDEVRTIVPLMQGTATDDWRGDWDRFVAALPENDCAAAVYNFQYWVQPAAEVDENGELLTDDQGNAIEADPAYFDLDPLLITWAPESIEAREVARYGYYLGALIVATDHPDEDFDLEVIGMDGFTGDTVDGFGTFGDYNDANGDGYKNFCMYREAMKGRSEGEATCSMIDDFHNCPFDYPTTPVYAISTDVSIANPCDVETVTACKGAQFVEPDSDDPASVAGAMTWDCCEYITDFCQQLEPRTDVPGCHEDALATIRALCDSRAPADEIQCFGDCGQVPCDGDEEGFRAQPDCAQPCPLMASPVETYQKCSGCPTSGLPQANGLTYQCHREAFGFLDMRCCGLHEDCEDAANQNEDSCGIYDQANDLGGQRCSWVQHAECQAIIDSQKIEYLFGQIEVNGDLVPNEDMTAPPSTATTAAEWGCCAIPGADDTISYTPTFNVRCPTESPPVIAAVGPAGTNGCTDGCSGEQTYEVEVDLIGAVSSDVVFVGAPAQGDDACAAMQAEAAEAAR